MMVKDRTDWKFGKTLLWNFLYTLLLKLHNIKMHEVKIIIFSSFSQYFVIVRSNGLSSLQNNFGVIVLKKCHSCRVQQNITLRNQYWVWNNLMFIHKHSKHYLYFVFFWVSNQTNCVVNLRAHVTDTLETVNRVHFVNLKWLLEILAFNDQHPVVNCKKLAHKWMDNNENIVFHFLLLE